MTTENPENSGEKPGRANAGKTKKGSGVFALLSPYLSDEAFKNAGWDVEKTPVFEPNREALQGSQRRHAAEPAPLADLESSSSSLSSPRAKSSLRLRYEAEVTVIKRKLGDLEQMRESLGLSQRKMCQLLLVDPSAWTRWTKGGEDAPPHVYRMLQWYLALEEKYPALDANFWLATVARVRDPIETRHLNEKTAELETEVTRLKASDEDLAQKFAARLLEVERAANQRQWMLLAGAVGASLVAGLLSALLF